MILAELLLFTYPDYAMGAVWFSRPVRRRNYVIVLL